MEVDKKDKPRNTRHYWRERKFVGIGYEEEEKLDWASCERRWVVKAGFRKENGGEETERTTKVWNNQ